MHEILGIDPGSNGALSSSNGHVFSFGKMSETDIFQELEGFTSPYCYLEKVHAMPGQGVTSMFTFGQNYGFIRGLLVALKIPFKEVQPKEWQKYHGLNKKYANQPERKRAHKAKAQILFPDQKVTLDNCDALLIMDYGAHQ